MNEIALSTSDHILILIMGVILPLFAVFQAQPQMKEMTFSTAEKLQIYYGNGIFQWIGTLAIIALWWINNRFYSDLGWGYPKMNGAAWALTLSSIFLYILNTWWELRSEEKIQQTREKWIKDIPFLPFNWNEYKHFLFVAFTAGVCEEIIFRGFFIQYFLAWNQDNEMGAWLAILIPGFLFAFGHLYQGHQAVIKIMLMAIIFGWLFILTESLWIPIILHFLVDAVSGYIAMRIIEKEEVGVGVDQEE